MHPFLHDLAVGRHRHAHSNRESAGSAACGLCWSTHPCRDRTSKPLPSSMQTHRHSPDGKPCRAARVMLGLLQLDACMHGPQGLFE